MCLSFWFVGVLMCCSLCMVVLRLLECSRMVVWFSCRSYCGFCLLLCVSLLFSLVVVVVWMRFGLLMLMMV